MVEGLSNWPQVRVTDGSFMELKLTFQTCFIIIIITQQLANEFHCVADVNCLVLRSFCYDLLVWKTSYGVTKTPRFQHITPILKSLHWLKIRQRIEFKTLSLTYKPFQYNQPTHLRQLITIQTGRNTRSSTAVNRYRKRQILTFSPIHLRI